MQFHGPQMLEFQEKGDERGHLIVCEGEGQDIPFDIKRIFYIYGTASGVIRGQHANRETEFVIINVAGTSKIRVRDGKGNEAVFTLNRPRTGVYIPRMIWKDMYDFSEDSVMLCLASEHYKPDEYIRNYEDFLKAVQEENAEV